MLEAGVQGLQALLIYGIGMLYQELAKEIANYLDPFSCLFGQLLHHNTTTLSYLLYPGEVSEHFDFQRRMHA